MKFGQREVYDLILFDENGSLIAKLDSLKKVDIFYDEYEETYFIIAKDALLNIDLLKFVGTENNQTDLQKYLGKKATISIKKSKNKVVKLLAKSIVREIETEKDQEIMLEFPIVSIVSKPSFSGNCCEVSEFDVVFKVIPSDDEFYKVHI